MVMTAANGGVSVFSPPAPAGACGAPAAGPADGGGGGFSDSDAMRVCHPQPRRTTSRRPWITTFSKYCPGRMQTSPPNSGSALMASLIDVYLPKLFTPSPTVLVQQQPHSLFPVDGGHSVR